MSRELTITRLGNQADGIAETDAGPVYVPFALPGERIAAEIEGQRGTLIEIFAPAPERIAPICPHFGACGGCAVQHLEWNRYLEWKRRRLVETLSLEGIDAPVDPPVAVGPHSRRRASFAVSRAGKDIRFGFRRERSHEVIDIDVCPVLVPKLEAAIPALREAARALLPEGEARMLATACDNGIDLNIDESKGRLRPITPAIATAIEAAGIIRVTQGDTPVLSLAMPRVECAGVTVELPPRAFLQASGEAEAAMAEFALAAMDKKTKRVADLYCGLGAFTFALARKAAVTAVELDSNLLGTLERTARRAQGLRPITTLRRDLAREPLSPMELKAFDAVLFDPPRAGALSQARTLARSGVPTAVAISCNPVSFAKDARALIDGGYRLARILPIDQFTYSPHIELAALFRRP
jgi:23S rRNA (uracil1939-C5)-methyltransferase